MCIITLGYHCQCTSRWRMTFNSREYSSKPVCVYPMSRLVLMSHCHRRSHMPLFSSLSQSRPEQNGRHLADDIYKCIFLNEHHCLLMSMNFLSVRLIMIKIGSVNSLALIRRQAITCTNIYHILWCAFAYLAFNEFSQSDQFCLISHEKDLAISPALFFNRTEI